MVKRNGKKTRGKWQKDIHACRFLGAHSLFIRSIIYKPANNNRALWKRPLLVQEAANDSGVQTKCSILSASPTYTHTIMATTTKKEKERKKTVAKMNSFRVSVGLGILLTTHTVHTHISLRSHYRENGKFSGCNKISRRQCAHAKLDHMYCVWWAVRHYVVP